VGASGLKWHYFLFFNFIFTILWVSANISLGMLFGHNWMAIAGYMKDSVPLAAVALISLYFAIKYFIKQLYHSRGERI